MRIIMVALLAALAGCAVAPPETPAPLPCCPCGCPPPAAATAPTPPAATGPATTATRAYRQTERSVATAVTAPGASADYIRAVDRADKLARQALRFLVAQDGHPTPEAIASARRTMDDLIQTLDRPQ